MTGVSLFIYNEYVLLINTYKMTLVYKFWELDFEMTKLSKVLNSQRNEFGMTCDKFKQSKEFKDAKKIFEGLKRISDKLVTSKEYKEEAKQLRKMGYAEKIKMKKEYQASLV